jgi:hypothetical protein
MDGEIRKTVRIHGVENLQRVRDILNQKTLTQPTLEEVLAAEEKRLGVKLRVVRKGKRDGS